MRRTWESFVEVKNASVMTYGKGKAGSGSEWPLPANAYVCVHWLEHFILM